MTRDDIIRMAREAGWAAGEAIGCLDALQNFAKIIASAERNRIYFETSSDFVKSAVEAEREACAQFIEDEYARQFESPWREDLAAAIRARGNA